MAGFDVVPATPAKLDKSAYAERLTTHSPSVP
jgi:hypothetical protein